MTDQMREYLAKTAQADRERNKAILAECRAELIRRGIYSANVHELQAYRHGTVQS